MEDLKERFIQAVAFCLAYDKYYEAREAQVAEFRPLAEWALTPSKNVQVDRPAPGNPDARIALVAGGATKIKGYVFESARLPEIRGASALLDRINLQDTKLLWQNKETDQPAGMGCEACLIYNNGGEALGFAPTKKAAWLADEIERLYTRETLVAQSVAVCRLFTLRQLKYGLQYGEQNDRAIIEQLLGYDPLARQTFGSLIATLALAKFRHREANPEDGRTLRLRGLAHFETVPFARRCSSCERRAAVVNAKVSQERDEDLPLCEPCARKRIFGMRTKRGDGYDKWWNEANFVWQPDEQGKSVKSWATEFEEWLEKGETSLRLGLRDGYARSGGRKQVPEWQKVRAARDLTEIAHGSKPQGFIGVVYADGNNMGALLEELKTPNDYATFAQSVYQANKDAVFEALAENLHPVEFERKPGDLMHPFEILSIGGDDLFLIVPADKALRITCGIARLVENRLRSDPQFQCQQGYQWKDVQRCRPDEANEHLGQDARHETIALPPQSEVSFSAGVVIADAHTPVFYLEDLASQLLKSAKSRAKWLKRERHYYGGTVDFLALKSVTAITGTVEQFRKAALTAADNCCARAVSHSANRRVPIGCVRK